MRASLICDNARIKLDDGDRSITIGSSLGILYTENVSDFKKAYSRALVALKQAKDNGKDCYVIYNS